MKSKDRKAYWSENLKLLGQLLFVWFIVSYGCGILFVDFLDKIRIGGFRLGFWFSQQGSIFVFIVLIWIYVRRMAALDKKYNVDEK